MAAVAVSGIVAPGGPAFFFLFLRLFIRSVVASVGGGAGTENRGLGSELREEEAGEVQHAVSTCSRRVVAGANNANWKCDVENTDKRKQSGPESDVEPALIPVNMHF